MRGKMKAQLWTYRIAAIGSDVLAAYPVVGFVLLADSGVMSVRR